MEERLREIGFTNDIESGVNCRFKFKGIVVDIMPTDDSSIGFKNKWYPKGYEHAENYTLDDGQVIRILTGPYFLATKLEAFKGRGGGDGRMSHDFEDIVFVLENREQLWVEIKKCDEELRQYLAIEFSALMENPYIYEWIESHVERGNTAPQTETIIRNINNWLAQTNGE